MQDEIDLRPYLAALWRRWYWVVGIAVVAAVAAFVFARILPPAYEASAVIMITEPQYQMEFDPRFGTEVQEPAYRAFPTLATSDGILARVVESYTPSTEAGVEAWDVHHLRGMVEATSEGDPRLLVLTVRAPTATDAAAIATVWADILAERGNEIYGSSEEDVSFLEAQFAQSKRALDEADAAVIEFQARNRTSILAAQLASLEETQQRYLTETIKIALLTQEIEDLQAQIGRQSAEGQAPPGASLTALLLQIRAYNAEATSSVLLEVRDDGVLLDTSVAEQMALLDDLAATLEARATEIDARLVGLEPRQLALQRELQEDATELARLLREQELAGETYVTLVRKLDEARIAAEEENELLQVGSYPSVPTEPASRGGILAAAAGGLLGFLAGVGIVLVLTLIEERPGAQPAAGSS
jgi:uncharacterized protein involved in exopolysaccharide biosynthesis